jgi:RNA recognition motif-containing protein
MGWVSMHCLSKWLHQRQQRLTFLLVFSAYGFVENVHRRDAEEAIRGQHGKDFNGEHLVVEWAQSPRNRYQDEHNHREGYSDDDKDYWRDESSSRYRSRSRSSCHCKRSSYSRKDRSRSRSRSPDETHRKARSRTYSLPAIAVLVLPLNELIDTE